MPPYAINEPAISPPAASSALSTSSCRTMRPRLAPIAARIAISRSRMVARASSMLATLQQAITSSRLTAPNSVYSTARKSRTTQSTTLMTWKR